MSHEDPPPPDTRPLPVLRGLIDSIDQEILQSLARRMALVTEVAAHKRQHQRKIRDFPREQEVIDSRRQRGERLGLSPEVIESLYRLILWASRDHQAAMRAEVPTDMQPKTVAIVGGQGALGQLLNRLFGELGHATLLADLNTPLTPEQAAANADVTVVCVPIAVTEQVIAQVGPHVREDCLLMDVTSLKRGPVEAMLRATRGSVVGTHPMFGPGVHSLQGQRVVVCEGRGSDWCEWVRSTFRARGLVITDSTPEEHDRAMANVQVLTHFQTQVLGATLARLGTPLSESLRFTSPAYLMELYVAARHFGQDPALYGPIEMDNPELSRVTHTFAQATQDVARLLAEGDQAGFARLFDEVRAFFGDFAAEASAQSRFLIDRLVERS